jgi:hypothetical protein
LSATNIFKVYAVRAQCGSFVEENRDAIALPDFVADTASERDAILECHAFDRNEGNNVGGTYPGMRAGMVIHVDEFKGAARAKDRGFANGFGFSSESDDATVVVGVHFVVEDVNAGNAAHGLDDGVDIGAIATFGKVRHTLNQSFH